MILHFNGWSAGICFVEPWWPLVEVSTYHGALGTRYLYEVRIYKVLYSLFIWEEI